ncbi:hypothetical protein ACWEQL_37160, partial [Kitasatospora sp. NPDC004240]
LTARGLPRRVPRGDGLPGTGEAPASGLRRVAVEREPAPGPAGTGGTGGTGGSGGSGAGTGATGTGGRRGVSAEELRRRLGGFQGGLRQAEAATGRPTGAAEQQERQER